MFIDSIERAIRKHLPGKNNAGFRKAARILAKKLPEDLRQYGDALYAPSKNAFYAIADEVQRVMDDCRKTAERNAELRKAIAEGCPFCGAQMRRNSSMAGWWQCSQLGAETHRADPTRPSCSFQGFLTE